ncbi:MAG TPA: phosphatidylserine decarboxylase [Pirellulales bacterium]|jgi:phosphatidylserine decarboxylase
MSRTEIESSTTAIEPLPANITSVQPGGGVCYRLELAWGKWRRWYLRTFRSGYVRRMAATRQGETTGCPHEILDPRDLKYCRNLCTARWDEADDPFTWRGRLPFARWGLAELQILGYPLLLVTVLLAFAPTPWWPLAMGTAVLLGLVVYFFRDPTRRVPSDPGLMVSPADGKIAEITPLEFDPFIGGAAVRIGIFLSIFNVHLNRVPCGSRVLCLRYLPGKFLNALKPESARENESMWIGLEEAGPSRRRLIVRQITGQFARRIVCSLRPGETLARGQQFGMIKLGSRTELILPAAGLEVLTQVGQRVKAGSSILAHYKER